MNQHITDTLKKLKKKYEPKGLIIIGVFGSFARGDETEQSDIDILYSCSEKVFELFHGWDFYRFLEEVKSDFENELGRKVDLADREGLHEIGRKYILPEVVYVS